MCLQSAADEVRMCEDAPLLPPAATAGARVSVTKRAYHVRRGHAPFEIYPRVLCSESCIVCHVDAPAGDSSHIPPLFSLLSLIKLSVPRLAV